jgi:hypothetical protein
MSSRELGMSVGQIFHSTLLHKLSYATIFELKFTYDTRYAFFGLGSFRAVNCRGQIDYTQ